MHKFCSSFYYLYKKIIDTKFKNRKIEKKKILLPEVIFVLQH